MNTFAAFLKSFVVSTCGGNVHAGHGGRRGVVLDRQQQTGCLVQAATHLLGLIDEHLNALGQLRAAIRQRVGALFASAQSWLVRLGDC